MYHITRTLLVLQQQSLGRILHTESLSPEGRLIFPTATQYIHASIKTWGLLMEIQACRAFINLRNGVYSRRGRPLQASCYFGENPCVLLMSADTVWMCVHTKCTSLVHCCRFFYAEKTTVFCVLWTTLPCGFFVLPLQSSVRDPTP